MTRKIRTNWWLLLLTGIIFVVLSIKIILHPIESILGLALFIGWASLISGVFQVSFAISGRKLFPNWNLRLFNGIINLLFGIIFLTHPALTAKALPFVFGFWMIFIGVSTFFVGVREQNNNVPGSWFDMLLGLIITLGGIWISYNPLMEAAMLSWLLSLAFMFYGFYFIVVSLMLSKFK